MPTFFFFPMTEKRKTSAPETPPRANPTAREIAQSE